MNQDAAMAQASAAKMAQPYAALSSEGLVALHMLDLAAQKGKMALTPLQINKLVYISHGWILGVFGRPLIDNSAGQIQAWKYGPVVVGLYHMLKSFGNRPVNIFDFYSRAARNDGFHDASLIPKPGEARPSRLAKFVADYSEVAKGLQWVFGNYTRYTGGQLITLTHQEGTPWHLCYNPGVLERWGFVSRNTHIPDSLIRAYYERRIKRSYR